jgi:hypothetical protein
MEDKIFKMLPVNEQIIDIIKQLIERCYKYESQFFETAADRNICEAELRDIYDTVDSVMSDLDLTEREEFEEEIENLEADIDDLKDYNDGLTGRERYVKNKVFRFSICFSKQKNPEIVKKLQDVDNKTSYILDLIKKDIEKGGKN